MEKTKYNEVTIFVADNGYTLSFKGYSGLPNEKGFKVAKTLEEVRTILIESLTPLLETK